MGGRVGLGILHELADVEVQLPRDAEAVGGGGAEDLAELGFARHRSHVAGDVAERHCFCASSKRRKRFPGCV